MRHWPLGLPSLFCWRQVVGFEEHEKAKDRPLLMQLVPISNVPTPPSGAMETDRHHKWLLATRLRVEEQLMRSLQWRNFQNLFFIFAQLEERN